MQQSQAPTGIVYRLKQPADRLYISAEACVGHYALCLTPEGAAIFESEAAAAAWARHALGAEIAARLVTEPGPRCLIATPHQDAGHAYILRFDASHHCIVGFRAPDVVSYCADRGPALKFESEGDAWTWARKNLGRAVMAHLEVVPVPRTGPRMPPRIPAG